jgi:nitronate monooxygenase
VIIAQGVEAGGHRGMFLETDVQNQLGTMALVPQVVDAVTVPVVAAGGITDARAVEAAQALGAASVQVGTAFLLAPESLTSAVHRAVLQSTAAERTVLTNVFSGKPARSVVNRMIEELGPISTVAPAFPVPSFVLARLRGAAEAAGSSDYSPLWAGQGAPLARAEPAGDIVRRLVGG